jgi:uncharacterized protein YfaS (alpha-2-macroglobulin family)
VLSRKKGLREVLASLTGLLILVSMACSLPFNANPTPGSTQATHSNGLPGQAPLAAASPQPAGSLPPALVESQPPPGAEIPLQGPITLYFNQPMQRASLEAALSTRPEVAGDLSWKDDKTLVFTPRQPLAPGSSLTLRVAALASSSQGLRLSQPVSLTYQAAGFLKLANALPAPGSREVDPGAAVLAAFNHLVVAPEGEAQSTPAAFQLEPQAKGRGVWLNGSAYAFYPDPPLQGGITYTVRLDPNLQSAGGGPLQGPTHWAFSTTAPRVVSLQPAAGNVPIRLDSPLVLTFNQPMDRQSVEASFSLTGPTGPVPGNSSWNPQGTEYTFRPGNLLARNAQYRVHLGEAARGLSGAPLQAAFSSLLRSVPGLAVSNAQPVPGGAIDVTQGVTLFFTTPVQGQDFLKWISLAPAVPNLRPAWNEAARSLHLAGNFAPATQYTLSVSPDLADVWGGRLGSPFSLDFHTAPLPPSLSVANGNEVLFVTAQSPQIPAQATNLTGLSLQSGSLPLQDFFRLLGPDGARLRQAYQPAGAISWVLPIDLQPNQSQAVQIPLAPPENHPLPPGLYFLRTSAPASGPLLVVLSQTHLTFKLSASDAFVWAVDLQSQQPVAGAPIAIYTQDGNQLASGQTASDGVFQAHIDRSAAPFQSYFVVLAQPGEAQFGLAANDWNQGVGRTNFNIPGDDRPPHLKVYLYSDRPVYRPGDELYFRAIARQAYNGRYRLPEMGGLSLALYGTDGTELDRQNVPLSTTGSGHGQFKLPQDLPPGTYSLRSSDAQDAYLPIQVIDGRRPELELQVELPGRGVQAGKPLAAWVSARYCFNAPAGDLPVHWALYAAPDPFVLPGYQVGALKPDWLARAGPPVQGPPGSGEAPGRLVSEGDTRSAADGSLKLNLSTQTDRTDPGLRQRYTLVVSATDAGGLLVSAQASALAYPAGDTIGIHSDSQLAQAGEPAGFDIQVLDWQGKPASGRALRAEFLKVDWPLAPAPIPPGGQQPASQPAYTPVASTDFETNAAGQARIAFDPQDPGTYQISVSDGQTSSVTLLWVSGAGQASWPALPDQRLPLTAGRESYSAGDTARVLVPNPWSGPALALVSVERGTLLRHQVLSIQGNGQVLEIPLTAEDAPNVYLSVTLLGRDPANRPDFRQGLLELAVAPQAESLHVALSGPPQRVAPGGAVQFELAASDDQGAPVQAEFSLAVVEQAAPAEPNTPVMQSAPMQSAPMQSAPMQSAGILEAFYGRQPLGVRTGLDLAVSAQRPRVVPDGMGGGGEITAASTAGQNIPSTAYWNAEIITGPDGKAQVSLTLPDSQATWLVQARGLTEDTRVGQAEMQFITSKELWVRPVVPRFLVVGDHLRLEAILQNNTDHDLRAQASLEASGFNLDDPTQASQTVSVPAQGSAPVEWWGSVQDVPGIDLGFHAQAGGLQDSAQPPGGTLPVLRYRLPQAFHAAGSLEGGGEQLESVSLPPGEALDGGGQLRLELSSSLAAAMLDGLQALEGSGTNNAETDLWRFLPNLEIYRVLQQFGLQDPALRARLDDDLQNSLPDLLGLQNEDGGWPWWPGGRSDPETSATVVFGLGRARQAGVNVDAQALQRGADYLRAALSTPTAAPTSALSARQLDTLALAQFALQSAGQPSDPAALSALYRLRSNLDPGAQALLALALATGAPDSPQARELLSALETAAVSANGEVHWELAQPRDPASRLSALANTALVTYALAQRAPGSTLLGEAVRYLMAQRQADGSWGTSLDSAWSLMALAEVMRGTGDLGGDFAFSAALNGVPLAAGQTGGPDQPTPVMAAVPASQLQPEAPNALLIQRQEGAGRLYYLAALDLSQPAAAIPPLQQGLAVERIVQPDGLDCARQDCPTLQQAKAGQKVIVRLSLSLAHEAFFLRLEDAIPAGAEILNTQIQSGPAGSEAAPASGSPYDPTRPYENGWGGWLFHPAQVSDDQINWAADRLPAGNYELAYTLVLLQAGEFQWLPAHAWLSYFPEVQGSSAGELFTIFP